MARTLCNIVVVMCALIGVQGRNFVPVITNFSSLDYRAGLQNWAIAQGRNGEMYIGNNEGVLTYDGYNWTKTPLPENTIARSLMTDGSRLYVGSYEEFGYFEHNELGNLHYTSLWKRIKGYKPHNDEIWNIVKTADGKVCFQSFCSWFEYDGHTVRAHYNAHRLPLYFFDIGGRINVQLINGGFCRLEGGHYREIVPRTSVGNDNVVSALRLQDGRILLCTEFRGLYVFDGKNTRKMAADDDMSLRRAQINRAVIAPNDSTIVIGTILDGIYGISLDGKTKWHYSTDNRLRNNTVLRLFCDRENNIWAALDAGIALIHSGSPYGLFTHSGSSLGMVYDFYRMKDHMYIATNQYTYLYDGSRMTPIAGTEGQNWHISAFGNQLIVGNNRGTKLIENLSATPVSGSSEASSTAIRRYLTGNGRDYLVEASYAELRIYRQKGGRWKFINGVKGFMAPIRQFEIDANGMIWAAHMNKGLYRIELNENMDRVVSVRYIASLGRAGGGSQIHVMRVLGQIVFGDGHKLYTTDYSNKIVPYEALDSVAEPDAISSTQVDNTQFWLSSPKGYTLIERHNGRFRKLLYVPAAFFGMECGDNMNNVRMFDGIAYFCMNGGVGCMNMGRLFEKSPVRTALRLVGVQYITADHVVHPMPVSGNPSSSGDVTLRLSYSNYNNEPLRFVFRLDGGGIRSETTSDLPQITYNSLSYGSYTFSAEAVDINGKTVGSVVYKFHYPRPLLLSIPAFIVYILLLGTLVYAYVRWSTGRILRRRARIMEAEKMRQDLQMAEQRSLIEEQQKMLLEQQLQDKGREIASLAMEGIRHRRQVSDIKQELQGTGMRSNSNKDIVRMLLHITDNIDNDAYWDIYRENFDLIHKNFFRHLREQYPSLTATDLKFCALLRLNLSTKDIAHFTGLTIRGVEGARYRLRRKLQIKETQSLTEFLIDFK